MKKRNEMRGKNFFDLIAKLLARILIKASFSAKIQRQQQQTTITENHKRNRQLYEREGERQSGKNKTESERGVRRRRQQKVVNEFAQRSATS